MTTRKKKGHGGLKFLAFVVFVGALVTSIVVGSKTEVGQRIAGNREDRRLERTSLTPRFTYASAKVRVTIGSIYKLEGTLADSTTTIDTSIDRQSERAASEVAFGPTGSEIAPGVDAVPVGGIAFSYNEVVTRDHMYISKEDESQPWSRSKVPPYYYGSQLDPYYIPMIDDLMGFELRAMPSKTVSVEPTSGFRPMARPAVNTPTGPSAVTRSYTYEMDMDTFRRAIPILASRADLRAPAKEPVTVTIGFDDTGLLRFADIAIATSIAKQRAHELDQYREAFYHYTIEVTEISGEPIVIEIPTNFVDEPDETIPVDSVPTDTVPVVTP